MDIVDILPILGSIPTVQKVIDLYRQLVLERDLRKVAFTLGAWVVGVGLVALISRTTIAGDLLAGFNWADIVVFGIALGATASVVHDVTHRVDTKIIADTANVFEEPTPPDVP